MDVACALPNVAHFARVDDGASGERANAHSQRDDSAAIDAGLAAYLDDVAFADVAVVDEVVAVAVDVAIIGGDNYC